MFLSLALPAIVYGVLSLTIAESPLLPIVWVGILLSVFQQFVGINVIFYYSTVLTITVIMFVTNIVVTVVAIAMIDRTGRRILLLIGSAGMALSLGTLSYSFGTAPVEGGEPVLSDAAGITALIAANLFVMFFGVSWGPAVWVLLGEIFNNRIRAGALGLAVAAQWIANFAISTSFPALADLGLPFAYGLYTFFAVLSFMFVMKFVRDQGATTRRHGLIRWCARPPLTGSDLVGCPDGPRSPRLADRQDRARIALPVAAGAIRLSR